MDRYTKFYPVTDLVSGINLEKAFKVVTKLNPSKQQFNINEIIELYNISLFIQNKIYLTSWSVQEKEYFNNSMPTLHQKVQLYFDNINKSNFLQKIKNLNRYYYDDFITLFGRYKLASKISEDQFSKMVRKKQIHLRILLRSKYIIDKYSQHIKTALLNDSLNAEILLDKYISDKQSALIIPSNITDEEKSLLIDQYLDNSSANYNYIKQIKNIRNEKNALVISDEIRLKAKRKENAETEQIFTSGNSISISCQIEFVTNQKKEVLYKDTKGMMHISFSLAWLQKHLDYNTVLNNFIYLFEYVDSNMRISLLSQYSDLGVFERFMGVKSKLDYEKGSAFTIKEIISTMEIVAYSKFLLKQNKSVEAAIDWFFNTYLVEEFQSPNFQISMPSQATTAKEKCQISIAEMERAIKEFGLYVKTGEIDSELLSISSDEVSYSIIPSLLKDKYVYSVDDHPNFKFMINAFFSDQSGLGYIDEDRNGSTLFELIKEHREINYNDFPAYNHASIDELIKMKLLKKHSDKVEFDNVPRIFILRDIFQTGFIEYQRVNKPLQTEIDKMKKEGLLKTESTLLAKPEADYFDYYLNKKKFSNGLNIRNQYSHGMQPSSSDEKTHFNNYMIILKLFVLVVIKINDEFCLVTDQKMSG